MLERKNKGTKQREIIKMKKYAAVIGASNIDIGGWPDNKLIYEDSNPGHINISYGGVGRNIAHNLSLLGLPVKLISSAGDDPMGRGLKEYCEDAGIDTSLFVNDKSTSSFYLYINDQNGDLALALSQISAEKSITPDHLDQVEEFINNAAIAVVDSNISLESFIHLKKICRVPIFLDPVSALKTKKLKGYLEGVDTIKPNRIEAEYLTGITLDSEKGYVKAAESLIDQGLKRAFISLGEEGILAADADNIFKISNYPCDIVSTAGAGDAAAAAIVWTSVHKDISDEKFLIYASKAANAAAAITISVKEANNPDLSIDRINEIVNNIGSTVIKLK